MVRHLIGENRASFFTLDTTIIKTANIGGSTLLNEKFEFKHLFLLCTWHSNPELNSVRRVDWPIGLY